MSAASPTSRAMRPTVLVRLLDAIIDRLADELEHVSAEIESISAAHLPQANRRQAHPGRAADRAADANRAGPDPARQDPLFGGQHQPDAELPRRHPAACTKRLQQRRARTSRSLTTDVTSLTEHASFLADNLTFLLDASLGLISIEQNAAMKLFSWAAMVFLPPTLIAGIYGMNFHYLPELIGSMAM